MAMTKAEKAVVEGLLLTLALRWPTEAMPTQLFGYGAYDKVIGSARPGVFYVAHGPHVEKVEVLETNAYAGGRFNTRSAENTKSVPRGAYYATEKEAYLHVLWEQCAQAASELRKHWQRYDEASE
jgi:hypothetical protein